MAGVLGGVLAAGWAAVAVAFALPALTGSPPHNVGDAVALAIVVIGVLLLGAVNLLGARAVWRGEAPRRASTGALCTVVVAGWPAVTALTRGLDGVLDPTGAAALALTIVGGATLILLHQARMDAIARESDPAAHS